MGCSSFLQLHPFFIILDKIKNTAVVIDHRGELVLEKIARLFPE